MPKTSTEVRQDCENELKSVLWNKNAKNYADTYKNEQKLLGRSWTDPHARWFRYQRWEWTVGPGLRVSTGLDLSSVQERRFKFCCRFLIVSRLFRQIKENALFHAKIWTLRKIITIGKSVQFRDRILIYLFTGLRLWLQGLVCLRCIVHYWSLAWSIEPRRIP